MRSKLLAVAAGTALAVSATTPASAAVWDGMPFTFGYGSEWEMSNFLIDDVYFQNTSESFSQPSNEDTYTDIWDGALYYEITSATSGVIGSTYDCNSEVDVDISVQDGDLVIDCTTPWDDVGNDVDIRGNMRIYGPDGDLVRHTLSITNNSGSDITDFSVVTVTGWGSNGDIWAYQNIVDVVLEVPAIEDDSNAAAIEETESNWVVNYTNGDPPGSLAWGSAEGSVDVALSATDGDSFYTETDTFTVAAGETVYLVYFTGWDPANLASLGYFDNDFVNEGDADIAAQAVSEAAQEFNTFSGRLTTGLEDANVINWGPATDVEEELADTGSDASALWAGLGLLLAGVAAVTVRRRTRA